METARRPVRGSRRRRSGHPLFGQLLTAAVESAADEVAVRYNPTGDPADQREMTYRELDGASSRLARELIGRGIGPGDVVAIGIARSPESVLSVWAVAKTGAAHVFVDPADPAARIDHLVVDSGAAFGLTTSKHRRALGRALYWIELDDPVQARRIADRPGHPLSYAERVRPLDEHHPAYIAYTGGAGVVVTHGAAAAVVAAVAEVYDIASDSRVAHRCPPNHDLSVLELLLTFSAGATLVIAPAGVAGSRDLAELIRREYVTHLITTAAALESVDPAGLDELVLVAIVGDRVGPQLAGRWARDRYVVLSYGHTEAAVVATHAGPVSPGEPITIGTAVRGIETFVLDARLRPVPAGEVGELYLAGPALAQGYLNRAVDTAERFVAGPFTGGPGTRMYRTGDLVRRIETSRGAEIEYLGRTDFQVTVHGFRIEPGDIDAVLTRHEAVEYAVTLGKTLPSGSTAPVSYVLPRAGSVVDADELPAFLTESLPAYMVPAAFVIVDELPLTPIGELDHGALPEPYFGGSASGPVSGEPSLAVPFGESASVAEFEESSTVAPVRESSSAGHFEERASVAAPGESFSPAPSRESASAAALGEASSPSPSEMSAPAAVYEELPAAAAGEVPASAGADGEHRPAVVSRISGPAGAAASGFGTADTAGFGETADPAEAPAQAPESPLAVGQEEFDRLRLVYPDLTEVLPLPAPGAELYFRSQLIAGGTGEQTRLVALELGGRPDIDRLHRAAQGLVDRHAALRTAYITTADGTPARAVLATAELPWQVVDDVGDYEMADLLAAEGRTDFAVDAAPLLRVTMYRTVSGRTHLVLVAHQLLFGSRATPYLLDDLVVLYALDGDPAALPAPPGIRSGPIAARASETARIRWSVALREARPTELAAVLAPPDEPETGFGDVDLTLGADETAAMAAYAAEAGVTVDTVVRAVWALLLASLTARTDIVFGAVAPGTDGTGGLLDRVIPVRVRFDPGWTVRDLLTLMDSEQATLERHHLGPAGTGPARLFDTVLAYAPGPADLPDVAGGFEILGVTTWAGTSHPVTLLVESADRLVLRLRYRRDTIGETSARALSALLHALTGQLLAVPAHAAVPAPGWWRAPGALAGHGELPADRPRPATASRRTGRLRRELPGDLHDALTNLAGKADTNEFTVVQAALAVLLARLSGNREIAVGAFATRGAAAGLSVLHTEIDPAGGFDALLDTAREAGAAPHGRTGQGGERLGYLIDTLRTVAGQPPFRVLLATDDEPGALPEKLDLRVDLVTTAGGAALIFSFARDLFDAPTVADHADRLIRILTAVAADAAVGVGDIDLLAPGERELVLREWNSAGTAVPAVTLVDLIEARARLNPDAPAVQYGETVSTFDELLARAYRVARAVIAAGAGPETVVAVAVPRGGELPAALLGVLLAGAAYLPIDSTAPRGRWETVLAAADPVAVLTTGSEHAAAAWGALPVVLVEDTESYPADPVTDADRWAVLRPTGLACVLPTGDIPQGVGITHRNIVQLFANTQLLFDFDDADVWTLCHSIASGLSVWELWCALAGGGSVVVVDEPTTGSPERLRELLVRENVTVFNQTPSEFYRFAAADRLAYAAGAAAIPALRYVVLGGEPLDLQALRDWYDRHPTPTGGDGNAPWLVNMYGITESTVHASFLALDEQLVDNPAGVIGRALPGLDAYVLDERLRPAPVGAPGEIYVAGAQLVRGYVGSPGHTATRFVADPFGAPGSRMYRSGDTGRWAAFAGRANLEYAGGGDRGFRAVSPEPEAAGRPPFAAPEGRAETVVAEVFTALLGAEGVGADDDFFALGGDSLLGSRAVAQINQALGADLTFRTLYEAPTVAALAARVVPAAAPPAPRPRLERAERPERIPLAPIQHRLLDRAGPVNSTDPARDTIVLTVGLTGALDTSALRYAISDVLERHEPLRTRYPADGRPYQDILPVAQALRGGVETAETDDIADAIAQLRAPAFDLRAAAPIRGLLFTTGADEYVLALVTHGIAADGGSRIPLVRDLMRAYLARVSGESPRWSPVPVQYMDYAVWHGAVLGDAADETSVAARQLDYWRRQLREPDEIAELPLDRPRTEPVSVLGGITECTVGAEVHRSLEAVAGDRDATVFMVVHAAVVVLLQRLTGAGDIAIGTRVTGRAEPGLDELVGRFANTLVLRTRVRPTQTFTDLLARARETDLAASAHADIPFEQVMADVAPERALFGVLLSIRETEQTVVQVPGLTVRAPVLDTAVAAYELQVDIDPRHETGGTPGELRFVLTYAADVLDEETVRSFGDRLTRILAAVAADPRMRVGDIDLDGDPHPAPEPAASPADPDPAGFPDGAVHLGETQLPAGTASAQTSPTASEEAPVRTALDRPLPVTAGSSATATVRAQTFSVALEEVPPGSSDAARAPDFSLAREGVPVATADTVRASAFSVAREEVPVATADTVHVSAFSVAGEEVPVATADTVRAQTFSVAPEGTPVVTAGTALAQTLSASVEDDPTAPAVVRGEQMLTYQELDARSSRLARVLIARGCGPGSGVVNALDRGADSVVATWAVLKAGAALVAADAVPVALATGLRVQVGLAVSAVAGQPGVEWIALDDPVSGAEIDAQSPRPVTHVHRTRPLRGADPVVVDATGRRIGYDRLATAVHRVHAATGLTYESGTYRHGRGDDPAAVLEIVAAGAAGATVVLLPDNARSVTPAGEWITHLWSGSAGLAVLDPESLPDLVALITDEPAAAGAGWTRVGCTLDLPTLLT